MCDNILELLPYIYAIYTMQEMSADPDYDRFYPNIFSIFDLTFFA